MNAANTEIFLSYGETSMRLSVEFETFMRFPYDFRKTLSSSCVAATFRMEITT